MIVVKALKAVSNRPSGIVKPKELYTTIGGKTIAVESDVESQRKWKPEFLTLGQALPCQPIGHAVTTKVGREEVLVSFHKHVDPCVTQLNSEVSHQLEVSAVVSSSLWFNTCVFFNELRLNFVSF